jgi:hypothetical protein
MKPLSEPHGAERLIRLFGVYCGRSPGHIA